MKQIIIFTDGSSLGNPGPGGWAAVINKEGEKITYSGGYRWTTNNRMELMAVIESLRRIKIDRTIPIKVFTDSRLLVDAIKNKWLEKWEKNYWWRGTTGKKEKVLNKDLWLDLLPLLAIHKVEFEWVKSHAGTLDNELADSLSKAEAQKKGNPPDLEYEKSNPVQLVNEFESNRSGSNVVYEEEIQFGRTVTKVRLYQSDDGNRYIEVIKLDEIPRFREVYTIDEFIEYSSFLYYYKNRAKLIFE